MYAKLVFYWLEEPSSNKNMSFVCALSSHLFYCKINLCYDNFILYIPSQELIDLTVEMEDNI